MSAIGFNYYASNSKVPECSRTIHRVDFSYLHDAHNYPMYSLRFRGSALRVSLSLRYSFTSAWGQLLNVWDLSIRLDSLYMPSEMSDDIPLTLHTPTFRNWWPVMHAPVGISKWTPTGMTDGAPDCTESYLLPFIRPTGGTVHDIHDGTIVTGNICIL